jgi:hypothetical protein
MSDSSFVLSKPLSLEAFRAGALAQCGPLQQLGSSLRHDGSAPGATEGIGRWDAGNLASRIEFRSIPPSPQQRRTPPFRAGLPNRSEFIGGMGKRSSPRG